MMGKLWELAKQACAWALAWPKRVCARAKRVCARAKQACAWALAWPKRVCARAKQACAWALAWAGRNWLRTVIFFAVTATTLAIIYYWSCLAGLLADKDGGSGNYRLVTVLAGTFAFVLATWRSVVANKQANAAAQQVTTAVKGQYSDRFAKAVDQVASGQLAVRLGGIASLDALSCETAEEYIRVWNYLGDFLRYPPDMDPWPSIKPLKMPNERGPQEIKGKPPASQRPDIGAIAAMMRNRRGLQIDVGLEFILPFSYVNLQWASLVGASLVSANLLEADMRHAFLLHANLERAGLKGADLSDAMLEKANLKGADLSDAMLEKANLKGADLSDAMLKKASLEGAIFGHQGTTKQDLSRCRGLLPEQLRGTYYDKEWESPILPSIWNGKFWPEGCKPQPISLTEWAEKYKILRKL